MQKREIFLLQEQVLHTLRDFFIDREFHEVFPVVLQSCIPLEPTIYPFYTHWQTELQNQQLMLSTSPEKHLKAALAAGLENCFGIGKSFRNLEQAGSLHQPEFTMLEWYRSNSNTIAIMQDVKDLFLHLARMHSSKQQAAPSESISYQHNLIDFTQWQTISIDAFFKQKFGIGLETLTTDTAMLQFAVDQGYDTQHSTWEQLFNQCFLNELEPTIGHTPTFIIDFPARISPLCAKQPSKPYLADRFEVYIGNMELGNGNLENTDTTEIRENFRAEAQSRPPIDQISQSVDTEFLSDLNKLKDKNCAGIGLGVERVLMLFSDTASISAVSPFHL